MEEVITKIQFDNIYEYTYKNTYYCGDFDSFTQNIESHTIEELKKIDKKMIVFNNYFSYNEINGDIIKYMENIIFEIKPLYDFWNTNINDSVLTEFIIIPSNLSKNDILDLSIQYIIDRLKKYYNNDEIEEYILNLHTIDSSINLDNIDFNKIVSIDIETKTIGNYIEDIEEDIDSGDDEIDIKNLDNETSDEDE